MSRNPMSLGTSNLERGPARHGATASFIESQLNKTRRNVWGVELADAVLTLIIGGLVFGIVVAVLDHWVIPGGMGRVGRFLWWGIGLGFAGWFIARRLVPVFRQSINPLYAADTIERGANRPLKNSIINWLMVRTSSAAPPNVIAALEEQAKTNLLKISVDVVVDRQRIIRGGYVLLALVVLMAGYKLFSPKDPLRSIGRILLPWAEINPPSRVSISTIEPGNIVVPRGQAVNLSAEIRGLTGGEEVFALYSTADGQTVDRRVPLTLPLGEYRYRGELPPGGGGMQQDASYRIIAGDGASQRFQITTSTAPSIVVDRVEYEFPSYTGIPAYVAHQAGDIRAIEGTKIKLHAQANQKIKSATIVFNGDATLTKPLAANDDTAQGSFLLEMSKDRAQPRYRQYQLQFLNEQGQSPPRPIVNLIETLRDQPPEIAITSPEVTETDLPVDRTADIEIAAHDPDFALRKVTLTGQNIGQKMITEVLLDEERKGPFAAKYHFDPRKLGLAPGDEITLWAEADDNRQPEANHSATAKKTIRILPSKGGSPPSTTPPREPKEKSGASDRPTRPNGSTEEKTPGTENSSPQESAANDPKRDPSQDSPGSPDPAHSENSAAQEEGRQQRDNTGNSKQQSSETPQQSVDNSGAQDGDAMQKMLDRLQEKKDQNQQPGSSRKQNEQRDAGQSKDNPRQQNNSAGGSQGSQSSAGQQSAGPKGGDSQQGSSAEKQNASGDASPKDGSDSGSGQSSNSPTPQGKSGRNDPGKSTTSQGGSSDPQNGSSPGNSQSNHGQGQTGSTESNPNGQEGAHEKSAGNPNANSSGNGKSNSQENPADAQSRAEKSNRLGNGQSGNGQNSPNQTQQSGTENGKEQSTGQGEQGTQGAEKSAQSREQQSTRDGNRGAEGQETPGEQPGMKNPSAQKSQPGKEASQSPDKNSSQSGSRSKTENSGQRNGEESKSAQGGSERSKGDPRQAEGNSTSPDQSTTQNSNNPGEPKKQTSQNPGNSQKDQADSRPGKGTQGDGQDSPTPGRGAEGTSSASDTGSNGGRESGDGDPTNRPGNKQTAPEKTGSSGDRSGNGTKNQSGAGEQPGAEHGDGNPSKSNPGKTSASGKQPTSENSSEGADQPGQPGGKPSTSGKNPNGQPDGSASPGSQPDGISNPGGVGGEDNSPRGDGAADEANLEYAQKVTDLVLEDLKHQLDSNRPDPELLRKLGWSKNDLEKFVHRWEEMRKASQTPGDKQAAAKEELSEALRSLGITPKSVKLGNRGVQNDKLDRLNESRRSKPPADYADQFRAYQQGTARGSQ